MKHQITTEVTMTSLELVEYINSQRKEGEAVLAHADFLKKVPKVLGEEGLGKFSDTYLHSQNGQTYPMYRFPKREACLMAMSYSYDIQAKVFDRMTALEEQLKLGSATKRAALPSEKPAITMTERQIRAARALLTGYAEDLKISKVSLAGAYLRLEEKAGLKGVLPHYVSEGPEAVTKGSEPGLSATELLRRKGIAVSAQRFNQLLLAAGFIEEKTRPSSKGGEKRYWSVTDFKYGKNETSPSNPRETQPLWYESQFDELLALVMPNGPSLVVLA